MTSNLKRRLAAAGVAVVVALGGAGAAVACDGSGSHAGVLAAQYSMHRGMHHHGLLRLASTYLGISADQLKSQLASGKTLAQIANATPGKSAAGLVDYIVAQAKAKLDTFVAAGKLTAAQETAWLARLSDKLAALVNGTWKREMSAFAWHHR